MPAASTPRVASLLPSATEIICALGLRDRLVGVSHECDFPAGVDGLPRLTRAKIDPRASSQQIDAAVRALVADGLSVYEIDTDLLRAAAPDVIVTQDQCDVCAVSLREVEAATRDLLGVNATIVSLRPTALAEIFTDIERVAEALGAQRAAWELLAALHARVDSVRKRTAAARYRPRVACIEWIEPLMLAGNWIPEIVTLGGGSYDAVAPGTHSPTWDWAQLAAYAPEVVLVMPCGFGLEQTRAELATLTEHPHWRELPAVRNGRAYAVDGNAYLNRPGPRLIDSAELLAGLIQPGHCASLLPPNSWEKI